MNEYLCKGPNRWSLNHFCAQNCWIHHHCWELGNLLPPWIYIYRRTRENNYNSWSKNRGNESKNRKSWKVFCLVWWNTVVCQMFTVLFILWFVNKFVYFFLATGKKTCQVLLLGFFFVVFTFLLTNRLWENPAGSVIKSCMQQNFFSFFLS